MMLDETMAELEAAGTEQNRKVYARHGVLPPAYGVSIATLRVLQKRLKTDQTLASGLWATRNHDARMLATMVANPAQANLALLNRWAADLSNYVLTDALAKLAASSPHWRDVMRAWMPAENEWQGAAGWTILAARASDAALSQDELQGDLDTIEREIAGRPNRVRYAMNNALIAIGMRNETLRAEAIAAAGRIGKVEVDHGETGCKTPDAVAYILKTVAHYEKQKAKGRGQSK